MVVAFAILGVSSNSDNINHEGAIDRSSGGYWRWGHSRCAGVRWLRPTVSHPEVGRRRATRHRGDQHNHILYSTNYKEFSSYFSSISI